MVKCKNCIHASEFSEDECGNYWYQCMIDGCWMEEKQYWEDEPCDLYVDNMDDDD